MCVTKEKALEIARRDAMQHYRDLGKYEITIKSDEGTWLVDYSLRDPSLVGGGPHYVISAHTGEIISRRYEQ